MKTILDILRFYHNVLLSLSFVLLAACGSMTALPQEPQEVASATSTTRSAPFTATPERPKPTMTIKPSPTPIISEHVIWKFQTSGAIWGSASIHNEKVYVGSDDGNLYAVDTATGEQAWVFKTAGVVRSRPAFAEIAAGESVFFSSDDGFLYALNTQDGELVWRADIGNVTELSVRNTIGSSPSPTGYDYVQSSPAFSEGRIYAGSADGKVYALNAENGEVLWSYQTGAQVRATPAIDDGTVYVGSWDKFMYALDAGTGELRWQTSLEGQIQSTAQVSENLVYSASRKAGVMALDTATGELQWEYGYGPNMWVESSPAIVDSILYIGSSGSRMVFGLDPLTGDMRLSYITGLFCWSKPLILEKIFVIGCTNFNSPDNGLQVLEIGPHPLDQNSLALTPKWKLPMGESLDISKEWSGVASSPIESNGVIYFGGLDGVLYAVKD